MDINSFKNANNVVDIQDLGEFGFIERLKPKFANIINSTNNEHNNFTGIGDDCAIIPKNESYNTIVTTDMLIEGVHFLKDDISPKELGYKSVAVNLSDIAAMGGKAIATFLSIAIPPNTSIEYLDSFIEGYLAISKQFNVPLMGGDTTSSLKHLVINVAVVGECLKSNTKIRAGAIEGDIICCTGNLGDSAAGLKLILDRHNNKQDINSYNKADYNYLINKHYCPTPRLKEGEFLAEFNSVHSMMDISDGIASDLKHILKASNVSAIVELNSIPTSKQIATCFPNKDNIIEMAIGGGEDYELLCTIAKSDFEKISLAYKKEFGSPLYSIGEITRGTNNTIKWLQNGLEIKEPTKGFKHF